MRVFSKSTTTAYGLTHLRAAAPLSVWHANMLRGKWTTYAQLKEQFANSVDLIANDVYVFNIGGNNFRLVASITFPKQRVYILAILTHAEYSKLSKAQLLALP